jgi:hypothetical protein
MDNFHTHCIDLIEITSKETATFRCAEELENGGTNGVMFG